jgi:hypothetical protein
MKRKLAIACCTLSAGMLMFLFQNFSDPRRERVSHLNSSIQYAYGVAKATETEIRNLRQANRHAEAEVLAVRHRDELFYLAQIILKRKRIIAEIKAAPPAPTPWLPPVPGK